MTNKEKAKIWAKIAKEIEEKGPSFLENCGLCSMGRQNGLDLEDSYGVTDRYGKTISGVAFMMQSANYSYLWPLTPKGAEHRVLAAQLIACYLEDEPND